MLIIDRRLSEEFCMRLLASRHVERENNGPVSHVRQVIIRWVAHSLCKGRRFRYRHAVQEYKSPPEE